MKAARMTREEMGLTTNAKWRGRERVALAMTGELVELYSRCEGGNKGLSF